MKDKRILINATQTEELRVAIVDIATQALLDLLVERKSYITKTGNIYMGLITAIEPSLDACFVNFGSERHGFLPFKEIALQYYNPNLSKPSRPIKDSLKIGQKIIVQVEKEERGNKGAALTTYISLAGSYLVLMPNNPRAGGISRRVEGGDRDELREILSNLPIPEEMGLIVRTAGVGKAITELQWDLNTLTKQWEAIQKAAADRNPPFLIHQESDIVIRAIRDYLREDVAEIWVDDLKIFERIKEHLEQIRPDFVHRLKLYTNPIPLFNRYRIEHQIEAAHEREVRLPSGGSIVIGHTEALVAIDVNSGQATKGKDIEQTAFEINKEAAAVIACQLRLRDIGGLIVIDFIDMPSMRHRREVENELRSALKLDKARTQVGSISPRFGLLEMSRQRLRHSLGEATRTLCPKCDGSGSIRSVESISLSILRMIEEDAIRPGTAQIQVQLPVDLATFMINEKREHITRIEKSQQIHILIIPNTKLESPHYQIKRLTETEGVGTGTPGSSPSYRLLDIAEPDIPYKKGGQYKPAEEKPAVQALFTEATPAHKKAAPNLVKRIISSLFGGPTESTQPTSKTKKEAHVQIASAQPVSVSDRNQRNQERMPQRNTLRNHSNQSRRSRNTPQTDRKISPLPMPKTHSTAVSSASGVGTSNTPDSRPRRGGRHGNMPQRNTAPITPPPIKKVEPQSPPSYLQPPLSDKDLEAYYQESAVFTQKQAVKTPTTVHPYNKDTAKTADSLLSSETYAPTQKVSSAKEEMPKAPPQNKRTSSTPVSEKNISSPGATRTQAPTKATIAPALSVPAEPALLPKPPSKQIIPIIPESKDWTPHKIASAPSPTVEAKEKEGNLPNTAKKESSAIKKAPRTAPSEEASTAQVTTSPSTTVESASAAHIHVSVTPAVSSPTSYIDEKSSPPVTSQKVPLDNTSIAEEEKS